MAQALALGATSQVKVRSPCAPLSSPAHLMVVVDLFCIPWGGCSSCLLVLADAARRAEQVVYGLYPFMARASLAWLGD